MKIKLPWRKPETEEKSWVDTQDGWLNTNWDLGYWQQNLKAPSGSRNEAVEACVAALAQTTAMCPVYHYEEDENGEKTRLRGSKAERVLQRPNTFTSSTQFFNMLIRSMYFHGNGYAVADRDGNGSIDKLYISDSRNTNGTIDPEGGEVYYWVGTGYGSYNPETDTVYPARDVLNLKINNNEREPLKGETPLTTAVRSIAANSNITNHQSNFFGSMARPSGVLSTTEPLTREQMTQLREAVQKQSQQEFSGGIPILGHGLTWQSMSLTSQDAQLVEAAGMTTANIARVFRVPLPLIQDMTGSTFNNASALMQWFLASGLGFLMNHIEGELNHLFGLPFNQSLHFDTRELLRSDFKAQVETLGEGLVKGLYSPNEARAILGMGPVEAGEEPRVQQQVVPLSAWDQEPPAPEPVVVDEDQARAAIMKGMRNVRSS